MNVSISTDDYFAISRFDRHFRSICNQLFSQKLYTFDIFDIYTYSRSYTLKSELLIISTSRPRKKETAAGKSWIPVDLN